MKHIKIQHLHKSNNAQESTKKNLPRTEEYLHRVGRSARIGKSGSALLFLQPSELGFLDVLRGRGLTDLREMPMEEILVGKGGSNMVKHTETHRM